MQCPGQCVTFLCRCLDSADATRPAVGGGAMVPWHCDLRSDCSGDVPRHRFERRGEWRTGMAVGGVRSASRHQPQRVCSSQGSAAVAGAATPRHCLEGMFECVCADSNLAMEAATTAATTNARDFLICVSCPRCWACVPDWVLPCRPATFVRNRPRE